jgi:uncharacterized membrane-anchored protein
MDYQMKRQIVYGLVSLVLTTLAAKLAVYITDRIVGKQED